MTEQQMSLTFLTGNETVLELGSNIGRNTILIGHILKSGGGTITTVESNSRFLSALQDGIRRSKLSNIKVCGNPISKNRIIIRGWNSHTIKHGVAVPSGWREVQVVSLDEVKLLHSVDHFDTLVIDCEGAFYHILLEYPEIMNGVQTVLIENDFKDRKHAEYVHSVFRTHELEPVWSTSIKRSHPSPCTQYFWQAWTISNHDASTATTDTKPAQ